MCMCFCHASMKLSLWSDHISFEYWGWSGVRYSAFFFFCLFFKLSMLLLLFSNHSLWNPEFSKSCLIIKSPIWCFACLWHHFNKCVLTQEKLCHQYVVCHMLCSSSSRIWYIFKSSHEAKLTQTVCDNIIVLWSFQGCKPYNAKVWEVALKLTLSH